MSLPVVERLRRSANAATLARQHRAGFYELPELVVSGLAAELREAADLIEQQAATIAERDARIEALEAGLRDFCLAAEYWAGCDEDCTPDQAVSEIMSSGGAWPAFAYETARAALERRGQ